MQEVQHVFIVGAKSMGAYGGYETFVNKLTEYHAREKQLQYHVACKGNGVGSRQESTMEGMTRLSRTEFMYHNAHCFKVFVPKWMGPAQAIWYDVMALKRACEIIRRENIPHPIVYILACRIGPFMAHWVRKIHALGGQVFLNPDGHEWKRGKWSLPIRRYWKYSEGQMVTRSDRIICDSENIRSYIHQSYNGKCAHGTDPVTDFIAYGTETRPSRLADDDPVFESWLRMKGLERGSYYLIVGRFVPENNYETMLREFMASDSTRSLAIIANANARLLAELEEKLHFSADSRVKFTGTVYDQELLMKIRENAWGYFHGHEVGGTNPSLLEALASTELNMLLDVCFNREVAEDAALYWDKTPGSLRDLIHRCDAMTPDRRLQLGSRAKNRIRSAYSWEHIAGQYAQAFLRKDLL